MDTVLLRSVHIVDCLENSLTDHVTLDGLGRGGRTGGGDVGHLLLELPQLVVLGVCVGEQGRDADGVTQHGVQALHYDHHDTDQRN